MKKFPEDTYLNTFPLSLKDLYPTQEEISQVLNVKGPWLQSPWPIYEPILPLKDVPMHLYNIDHNKIKTQKAKGIAILTSRSRFSGSLLMGLSGIGNISLWPQQKQENGISYPAFARPCPLFPRHGFVESRVVKDQASAEKVFEEARNEDPDAEMILMPPFSGEYSGIITAAGITFGKGNDGVTSNTSKTITIPAPSNPEKFNQKFYSYSNGLDIKNSLYVEFVENNDDIYAVQLRDGPEQPSTTNYIPKKITVKQIICPGMHDLLYWEKRMQTASPGTVVWINEGALSSHYAVHAILNKIPVIVDHQPKIGDVLFPSKKTPELTKRDILKLRSRVAFLMRQDLFKTKKLNNDIVRTAIATFHSMSTWDSSPILMKLRAISVVATLRAIYAALAGELRHWNSSGPGRIRNGGLRTWGILSNPKAPQRSTVYRRFLKPEATIKMGNNLGRMVEDFSDNANWNRGYGGCAWAAVAQATKAFSIAVKRFIRNPTPLMWKKVVLSQNIAIHTAHNNGYALNKWITGSDMDTMAELPALGFVNSFVPKILFGNNKEISNV